MRGFTSWFKLVFTNFTGASSRLVGLGFSKLVASCKCLIIKDLQFYFSDGVTASEHEILRVLEHFYLALQFHPITLTSLAAEIQTAKFYSGTSSDNGNQY